MYLCQSGHIRLIVIFFRSLGVTCFWGGCLILADHAQFLMYRVTIPSHLHHPQLEVSLQLLNFFALGLAELLEFFSEWRQPILQFLVFQLPLITFSLRCTQFFFQLDGLNLVSKVSGVLLCFLGTVEISRSISFLKHWPINSHYVHGVGGLREGHGGTGVAGHGPALLLFLVGGLLAQAFGFLGGWQGFF